MKQQPHYRRKVKYGTLKHINTQPHKLSKRKPLLTMSPLQKYHNTHPIQKSNHQRQRQDERNIGQNISLIATNQQASFISNKQDRSLDSFDKMIIGGDEFIGDLQDQYTNNSKDVDINYTSLYLEFQRLIKSDKIQRITYSYEHQDQKYKILEQELFEPQPQPQHQPQPEPEEQKSKEQSFQANLNNLSHIKSLKIKLQEIKQLRRQKSATSNPDISIRLLGANLSEIHEQQIQHNTSINRMDPIQEEFINFVSKNNEASKINISKIEKNIVREEKKVNKLKNQLNSSLKQAEEDEVVAMLENQLGSRRQNLIQESITQDQPFSREKKKSTKQFFQKQNYNHILRELDENQDKKLDISQLNISSIISKRQQWINNRKDRSIRWKNKQLALLNRIKEISHNPYAEFSDSESGQE